MDGTDKKAETEMNGVSAGRLLKALATEPGLAMIGAHVLLSGAAGGLALAVAGASFVTAASLKIARETNMAERFESGRLKKIIESVNTPMKTAGIALLALSGLSFGSGLGLLGTAFALFGGGNLVYNTPLSKKFPIDNVLFTAGSAITAFIAGGSLLTSGLIGAAGSLSVYNLVKPKGNRNLGRPKLWFAAAQATSAALGFLSGQPSRLLPSFAMCSVTWGYVAMEGRISGWFGNRAQPSQDRLPQTETENAVPGPDIGPRPSHTLSPYPAEKIARMVRDINGGAEMTISESFSQRSTNEPDGQTPARRRHENGWLTPPAP